MTEQTQEKVEVARKMLAMLASNQTAALTPSEVQALEDSIPLIEKPYTKMLADIQAGKCLHNQSTYGPDADPETNICKTQMCTAGHLVNMGGKAGYELKEKFGFPMAASLIHFKAHPDKPCQNFGMIKQEWAIAYIEEMAELESQE